MEPSRRLFTQARGTPRVLVTLVLALVCALLLAAAPGAFAQKLQSSAFAGAASPADPYFRFVSEGWDEASASYSVRYTAPSNYPLRWTQADSNIVMRSGWGQVFAYGWAEMDGGPLFADMVGTAHYDDRLTIDAAGMAGARGRLTVSYSLEWRLSASSDHGGPVTAQTSLHVQQGDEFASFYETVDGTGRRLRDGHLGDVPVMWSGEAFTFTRTSEFSFGVPFDISMDLASSAVAGEAPYSPSLGYDFAETYGVHGFWGGVVAVENLDGSPIAEYSLASASGAEYSHALGELELPPITPPIPEPQTAALGLVGLVWMAGLAINRRGRSPQVQA